MQLQLNASQAVKMTVYDFIKTAGFGISGFPRIYSMIQLF
jgi:hypothetical protein